MREADILTTFMCRMSWKSVSLNLLEPSGPHRACCGIPLPLRRLLDTSKRLGFPQRQPLPRSRAKSRVTNCNSVVIGSHEPDGARRVSQSVSQSLFSSHWNLVLRRNTSRDSATERETCCALLNSPHGHPINSTAHP